LQPDVACCSRPCFFFHFPFTHGRVQPTSFFLLLLTPADNCVFFLAGRTQLASRCASRTRLGGPQPAGAAREASSAQAS
jgi:hypothetical protein